MKIKTLRTIYVPEASSESSASKHSPPELGIDTQ